MRYNHEQKFCFSMTVRKRDAAWTPRGPWRGFAGHVTAYDPHTARRRMLNKLLEDGYQVRRMTIVNVVPR